LRDVGHNYEFEDAMSFGAFADRREIEKTPTREKNSVFIPDTKKGRRRDGDDDGRGRRKSRGVRQDGARDEREEEVDLGQSGEKYRNAASAKISFRQLRQEVGYENKSALRSRRPKSRNDDLCGRARACMTISADYDAVTGMNGPACLR
jgi:hypothetical protein